MNMKSIKQLTIIVAIILSAVVIIPVYGDDDHGNSKIIPTTEAPSLVMDAAKKAVPGIKITSTEKEKNDNKTIYEIKGNVANKEYEIKISSQGKVLKTEVETNEDDDDDWDDEENIKLSDVPVKIKKAVIKIIPGIKLTEAEIKIKDLVKIYELEGRVKNYDYEIKITLEGKILKIEKEKSGFFTRLFDSIF